jgi:hypothetical protein
MTDDLTRMWEKFSLIEEEDDEVQVQANDFQAVTSRGRFCVVGKLVESQYVSKEILKNTLQRWWKVVGTMIFKVSGENLFIIKFDNENDKNSVLKGRLWVFDKTLFLMENYNDRTPLMKLTFDKVAFWVKMHYLPLGCMGREVGQKIGLSVGVVEEVDT